MIIARDGFDNPEVKAFFKFLHPLVKLPSQKDLGGRILEESAQKINIFIQEVAQKDTNSITLAYDNWKNIKKESIFGSILITSMGKVLIWNAKDILNKHTRWFDVQHKTEDMLNNLNKEEIKVNAVVTDCASQYEVARQYYIQVN
ncbi:2757_t:CDS:2 [Cetraspora pellucida]|uniref:2757_t:CDS:1 n=1 Tax=Cetraspora pellucida TaxID=1433469 RepID=A0A9N8W573_9GLOM|nr:2757_t:CDS:2 [Cetraspora pellucida]